ncbi:hypothetical protein ACQ3G4_14580 [bacterium BS0013]
MKIIKNLFTFMSHVMDATSYYTKNCMGIKKRNSQGWTLRNIKNIVLKIEQVFCPVDNTLRAQAAGTPPCGWYSPVCQNTVQAPHQHD